MSSSIQLFAAHSSVHERGTPVSVTLDWFAPLDSTGDSNIISLDTNSNGSSVGCGLFSGNLNISSSSISSNGGDDIVIVKYDSDGMIEWIVTAGGVGDDACKDIHFSLGGEIMVVGYFEENATMGSFQLNSGGGKDAWFGLLNSSGDWIIADSGGGSGHDSCTAISSTSDGDMIISGYVQSNDSQFDSITLGTPGKMSFVARYDTASGFQWFQSINSSLSNHISSAVVGGGDQVTLTGYYRGTLSFNGSSITIPQTEVEDNDIFVAKLTSSGSWIWADRAGGSGQDKSYDIAMTIDGEFAITGYVSSGQTNPTLGSGTSALSVVMTSGSYDVLVALIDSNGVWQDSITAGGSGNDIGFSLDTDNVGRLYVSGRTQNNATFGQLIIGQSGTGDEAFSAIISNQFSWLWSTSMGGNGEDRSNAISVSAPFDFIIAGRAFGPGQVLDYNYSAPTRDRGFTIRISPDQDGDSVVDRRDNCQSVANPTQSDYDDDGIGDKCEDDTDGDGVPDTQDSCTFGVLDWVSSSSSDHDGDGCLDSSEDSDDDNDGIADVVDDCEKGSINWNSNSSTDHDGDGCRDATEDDDDDNDSLVDDSDSCPRGEIEWYSDSTTDIDGDGCRDSGEDDDDDNDGIKDNLDACSPPDGRLGWSSTPSTDNDADGCRDSDEDDDDDNDGIKDDLDSCPRGEVGWMSSDRDGDGCRDETEDDDDDDDGVDDDDDRCEFGFMGWRSNSTTDYDGDGCVDSTPEDDDDDNDGVNDEFDDCPKNELGWISDEVSDYDGDGCRDSSEDLDDDEDGIPDDEDYCNPSAEKQFAKIIPPEHNLCFTAALSVVKGDQNGYLALLLWLIPSLAVLGVVLLTRAKLPKLKLAVERKFKMRGENLKSVMEWLDKFGALRGKIIRFLDEEQSVESIPGLLSDLHGDTVDKSVIRALKHTIQAGILVDNNTRSSKNQMKEELLSQGTDEYLADAAIEFWSTIYE